MGLNARSSSHLASTPHFRARPSSFPALRVSPTHLEAACLVWPGVPVPMETVIDAPAPSSLSPGRDAPFLPFHPFLSVPFPLRFLPPFSHPPSVSPWRGAGTVAVADVDAASRAGSVSTSVY